MATNTVTKPTTIPVWARTTSNITEPASGKKDSGWLLGGVHSSAEENWLAKSTGDWCNWLNERLADGVDLDELIVTTALEIDASGVATTNRPALTVLGAKGGSPALFIRGTLPSTTGSGGNAGYFQGGNANTSGSGGAALDCEGGIATGGSSDGGTCILADGGMGSGTGNGGIALVATGGTTTGSGDTGVAVHAKSIADDGNHAIVAESKLAAPKYSALRVIPQNANPTSGAEGDIFTTSASHADGAGHLKKYHGGKFRHVGVQAYARITVSSGSVLTLDKNIGVSSINLQTGNTEIRVNLDENFSDSDYVVVGTNLQGQPMFVTAESQQINYFDVSLYSLVTSAKIDFSSTTTQFSLMICGD